MSLISLLIALAAERYFSSATWQFNVHFTHYSKWFNRLLGGAKSKRSTIINIAFILTPVIACYFLLQLVDDGLVHFLLSTLILIACFGCIKTRDTYKQYLLCAFRGEQTSCEMHHQQLLEDKNLPQMSFGQMLIWLNYRYFIAIMLFFVVFGAPGALAYRLVSKVVEQQGQSETDSQESAPDPSTKSAEQLQVEQFNYQLLFWLDWLPVRIVAFGYMLVGHFSRALPVWLENLFDVGKLPHLILTEVAQKSEDFMVDQEDCTAEPCLLVRLAKRTLLLCLALIALLILTGVMS
ncbi:beta-lactamase regulator AmpE [Thalassotalea sp. G2M2-11]|uniref:beta-lactamase regulator AmpE n=1 Tax=Thalassotalea sp. G2M2-11 TaxID=2787627 RepID=UPI0019D2EB22|nr:beta-lactamase regulator AmpE [Thalassotalea sp. G2M2-11]